MRTSPASTTVPARRPRLRRSLAAAAAATLLLAACSGDDEDALTAAPPVDDIDVGDDPQDTDAKPLPDVPGVTDAAPSDDVATSAEPASDVTTGAAGEVPALLDAVDGWPESTVTLDDEHDVLVKVASDAQQRQQGLMDVEDLPDGVGMLFLFDEPSTGGFWMKNTLVPLDIAYILDGEVVSIAQMDPCTEDPCPTYDPDGEYDAALEVNQGALADLGVDVGSTVTWTDPAEVDAA